MRISPVSEVVRKAMPDDVLTDTSFIKDLGLATHFAVPASFVIFAYQMQMRHDAEVCRTPLAGNQDRRLISLTPAASSCLPRSSSMGR
jgi:hypothetical protein